MKPRVGFAVLAALPREIHGLVGRVRPEPALLRQGIHLYRLPEAVVATAGMGQARVALAFAAAINACHPSTVLSVGLAGACGSDTAAGSVYEAGLVIDSQTGERFETGQENIAPTLVTIAAIAGIQEKARLAEAYGAAMVDMEAATVARLALAHGLPFRAIKGISDAHDFEMASLSRFAGAQGQFRTAAFALHTALRPHHWRPAARLGRNSYRALESLHARLFEFIPRT